MAGTTIELSWQAREQNRRTLQRWASRGNREIVSPVVRYRAYTPKNPIDDPRDAYEDAAVI